ncbi:MAG: bifunctional shikimate kinase/3-dehydroquinate synthase [Actinomycetota bacterium]|nr:bifunctional shikimate kinase/3-dehydroquinate synthase [Actinomycetota bacterium]
MASLSGRPRRPAIAFIGFMGAGKTRAARGAAAVLGEGAVDVDAEIERELGKPVARVFAEDGEARFREVEEMVAVHALKEGGLVSLGGGAVESERVREALAAAYCVWCRIEEEAAWRRCEGTERPLVRDRGAFSDRFAARAPLYASLADAVLTDGGERVGRRAATWLRGAAGLRARLAWAGSTSGEYPAIVGDGALGLLEYAERPTSRAPAPTAGRSSPSRWFCVADPGALAHQRSRLPAVEATIEAGGDEALKTLAEAERVLRALARKGARRDDGVLAFGGGVVGDLAGFCAATYQRGVPVVQAPTTLVAQVDSAYGGKTGVDLPEARNYAGAYHMPSAVLVEPGALSTLPAAELAAGFAEVLKTALIAGGGLWERVSAMESLDAAALGEVVFDCARTKIDIVASDERDSDRRQVLNLGHTIGHSIEAASGYGRYRHGEAVALGLLAALGLSGAGELRSRSKEILGRVGLPTALDPAVSTDDVMAALRRDKKSDAEGVPFVLLERPGEPVIGARLDEGMVRSAVEELRTS